MTTLRSTMTVEAFEANYYYAAELKKFAQSVGIRVGSMRKLELEATIKSFLKTGRVPQKKTPKSQRVRGIRDTLTLTARIVNYVDDKATKEFLLNEVWKMNRSLRIKSGQWYWLNDWRRKLLEAGKPLTYRDSVLHLHDLMSRPDRLPQIPSARYNNFVTDFLADPENRGKCKSDAMNAWLVIKAVPGPKTYAAYRQYLKY